MASSMRSASCWRSRRARRSCRCRPSTPVPANTSPTIFYVVSLLTVLSISLAYNLWPLTPAKWILRRFDHAAIYLLIAATYTPFLAQLDDAAMTGWMIAVVWGAAIAGMAIKLFLPGRFDRLAILFYLAIGWSGDDRRAASAGHLPPVTIGLILAGGIVYSGRRCVLLSGRNCASRTRSGTVSSSPAPACTVRQSSTAWSSRAFEQPNLVPKRLLKRFARFQFRHNSA